jgi:hypothetical protein
LAEEFGISHNIMIRILNEPIKTLNQLAGVFSKLTKKWRYLIINDTFIEKIYFRWTQERGDNYSTTDNEPKPYLCPIVTKIYTFVKSSKD